MIGFIQEIVGSVIGTIAFSLLYGVPKQYYLSCGLVGGVGWFFYLISKPVMGTSLAVFVSTLVIVFLSRFFAVRKQCPVTIFLIAGIFPSVPGAGICLTVYYIVVNDLQTALVTGLGAVKVAIAIVLGIVVTFGLPQKWFQKLGKLGLKETIQS